MNTYNNQIDKKIEQLRESNMYKTKIVNTEHKDIIKDLDLGIFKIETMLFIKDFLNTKLCHCGCKISKMLYDSKLTRADLIKKALETLQPDITVEIMLKDLLISYFEQHKIHNISLKCNRCFLKETLDTESLDKDTIKEKAVFSETNLSNFSNLTTIDKLTKDEMLQMKVIQIKNLLKESNIAFKSKDKKSILIRKYFLHIKEENKKAETKRLNNLTTTELKKILITKNISFDDKDKKSILIEKVLN